MSPKSVVMSFMLLGSTIGGFIPSLWGADLLSGSAILCSSVGAFAGIWIGYKISKYM